MLNFLLIKEVDDMYSIDIKDSTLKEVSYNNNIHYLEIGNYLPLQYPVKNEDLNNNDFSFLSFNKVFIAIYDYTVGDSYSIFGKTLKLLNKDLMILKGDYVKATVDLMDNTIKLVNLSRLYYTPKKVFSDIDFSHNKMVEATDVGNSIELFDISVRCNENTDIYINTSVYVDMGKGEVNTSLWCDEISADEALSVSTYTSNMPKRAAVQNGYCIKDAKKGNAYTIRLIVEYTMMDYINGQNNECMLLDMASNIFINAKDIELNYPCYNNTFYYKEHDTYVEILYLKDTSDTYSVPKTINGKPVTTLNQGVFHRIGGTSVSLDSVTDIQDGAFYKSTIKNISLPSNGNTITLGAYAFARTNVNNIVIDSDCKIITIPYCCFEGAILDTLDIQANTEILEPMCFSNTTIQNTTIGSSVKELQKDCFKDAITYNFAVCDGLQIFNHDGTIFGNITIPSTVTQLSLYDIVGNINFNKMSKDISELTIQNLWVNKSYPELKDDYDNEIISNMKNPGFTAGYYNDVHIPTSIKTVDIGQTLCDDVYIDEREDSLVVKNFNVMPCSAVPRYNMVLNGSDSFIECVSDPNTIHPLDLSENIEFAEDSKITDFHSMINPNDRYAKTNARLLMPKYSKHLPSNFVIHRDVGSSSNNGYNYYTLFSTYFGGLSFNIPETEVIKKDTFKYHSLFCNDTTAVECIVCKEIETGAFNAGYFSSTSTSQTLYGDNWYRALICYGCETIRTKAFDGYVNLTQFYIPPTVTTLENNAFHTGIKSGTSVNNVYLYVPNTLSGIGNSSYYNNSNVKFNITYYDATYQSFFNFTDSSTYSTITGFKNSNQYIGTWVIPEEHNGLPVTTMNAIFNGNTLTSLHEIIIKGPITSIVSNTFKNCKRLLRVWLSESVSSIGTYAFYGCLKLNRLEFHGCNITSIGAYAFYQVGYSKDFFDSAPTNNYYGRLDAYNNGVLPLFRVNNNKFGTQEYYRQDMSRFNLEITDNITTIGQYAFYKSIVPVGKIKLPENSSYKTIEQYTFYGAPYITELYVPDTITSISNYALCNMYGCKKIRIGSGTTVNTTFEGCEMLEELDWSVNKLTSKMFKNCHSLKTITIPASISTIPEECFYGCTSLETVIFEGTNINIGVRAFANCTSLTTIDTSRIKSVALASFQNTRLSNDVVNAIIAKNLTVSTLFADNPNITSITLPNSYTLSISEFENCINLGIVNGGTSVTKIPENCFKNTRIDSASIADLTTNSTVLDSYCFADNPVITSVNIPANATTVNTGVFSNCINIKSFTWNSTAVIPNKCFYMCSLSDMTSLPNISSFGDYCFYGAKFKNLDIYSATYGTNAFENCNQLQTIHVIDSGAHELYFKAACFIYCTLLKSITFDTTIRTARLEAFLFEYCRNIDINLDFYNNFDDVYLEGIHYTYTVDGSSKHSNAIFNYVSDIKYPEIPDITFSAAFHTTSTKNYPPTILMGRMIRKLTFNKSIPAYAAYHQYSVEYTISENTYRNLTDITLGPEFTEIQRYAFYYMSSFNVYLNVHNNTTLPWSIATYAFAYCTKLYTIDLHNCASIETYAFYNATSLITVTNLEAIALPNYCFYKCTSLKNIDLSSVSEFGGYSMAYSGIVLGTSFEFGENVTYIGVNAFQNCNVSRAVFNDKAHLRYLGRFAFAGCSNLSLVHFPATPIDEFGMPITDTSLLDNDPQYIKTVDYAFQDVDFSKYKDTGYTIPACCTTFSGCKEFYNCKNLTELIIPDTVTDFMSSTSNGYLIQNSSITTLTFTGNRTTFAYTGSSTPHLFESSTNLTTVNMPDTITAILPYMFKRCNKLTTINFPDACVTIGKYAFQNCTSLTEVRLSPNTTSVETYAFSGCSKLTKVYLPKSCTIGKSAFPSSATLVYYEDL